MTDEPNRWTRSPLDEIYGTRLYLPSFGIGITRSAPSSVTIPARWSNPDLLNLDSGDAFSVSYLYADTGAVNADQDYMRLDSGYLRRVLLQILDREEYQEIVRHHDALKHLEPEPGLPEGQWPTLMDLRLVEDPDPRAQVRLSDLRLAKDLPPRALKRELKAVTGDLRLPITTDSVTRWKYDTLKKYKTPLKKPHEWSAREDEEERIRVIAVSFAAAAILLFLDLDMSRLEQAGRAELTKLILALHNIIRKLVEDLDRHTGHLRKLLQRSEGGRPPDPEVKYYTALVLHRMGHPDEQIALRIGITPPDPYGDSQDYNKNWKNKVRDAIERGREIEQTRFPRAAAVFARGCDERVRVKAIKTYREYLHRSGWSEAAQYLISVGTGDDLLDGISLDEEREVYRAYVQLGSCLENGIPLVPRSSS